MRNGNRQILTIIFIGIISTLTIQAGWHVEELITENNFDSWTTQSLAVGPDGSQYIVYGGDNLRLAIYNGATWSIEIVDSTPDSGQNPVIQVDAAGNIHIVYGCGNDLMYVFRADGSTEWLNHIIRPNIYSYVCMQVDTDNHVHLAARDSLRRMIYLYYDGNEWLEEYVELGSYRNWGGSLALTSDNQPVICFTSGLILGYDSTGNPIHGDVNTKIASRDSTGWTVNTIYAMGAQLFNQALILDDNGFPFFVGIDHNSFLHDGVVSVHWNGYVWDIEVIEDPNQWIFSSFNLKKDQQGRFHLVYNLGGQMKYAVKTGASWNIQTVSTDEHYWASLALTSTDDPVIAAFSKYNDPPDSNRVDVAQKDASGWVLETVDTSAHRDNFSHGSDRLALAMDSQGSPHCVVAHQGALYHVFLQDAEWVFEIITDENYWHSDIFIDDQDHLHVCFGSYYAVNEGGGWNIQPIDIEDSQAISLALDLDGYPCLAAYGYHSGYLTFVRLRSTQEWYHWDIETGGDAGEYSAIAIDSTGLAHISYYDAVNNDLKYAKGFDNAWTIETVDSEGFTGYYNEITLDSNDLPYISFAGNWLKLAHFSGMEWTITPIVDLDSSSFTTVVLDLNEYPHLTCNNMYAKWDGGQWITEQFYQSSCRDTVMGLTSAGEPGILFWDKQDDLRYTYPIENAPDIASVTPDTVVQGQTPVDVIVIGTNFTGAQTVDFGQGIRVDQLVVDSDEQITAQITVDPFARRGTRHIVVTTPEGESLCPGCFEVFYAVPVIEHVEPSVCPKGMSHQLFLSGMNFEFTSNVDFGSGIVVETYEVLNNEEIFIDLTIDSGADVGYRDVILTTPSGSDACIDGFYVDYELTSIQSYSIDPIPEQIYADTPFQIRVKALDYFERVIPTYNGTAHVYDNVTGTLEPGEINIVNGVGLMEATISEGAGYDWIRAYSVSPGAEGFSNTFDVIKPIADCGFETVDRQVFLHEYEFWEIGRTIQVADDGTVWVVYGYDNLWAQKYQNDLWTLYLVDDMPGIGQNARLALDSQGNPHIAYCSITSNTVKYARLTEFGWHLETIGTHSVSSSVAIALGPDDTPWVAYSYDVQFCAYRSAEGWVSTQICEYPNITNDIAVDSDNHPHVVSTNNFDNYLHYDEFTGAEWQDTPMLYLDNNESVSVAVDSNNEPHIVYSLTPSVQYTYRDNSTWHSSVIPNMGDEFCHHSQITLTDQDYPIVSLRYTNYTDDRDTVLGSRTCIWNGSSWNVIPLPENVCYSTMCRANTGEFHYQCSNFNRWEYYKWTGAQWEQTVFSESTETGFNSTILQCTEDQITMAYVARITQTGAGTGGANIFRIKIAESSDSGWRIEDVLTREDGFIMSMDSTMREDGTIVFAYILSIWGASDERINELYYCEKNGGVWESELIETWLNEEPYAWTHDICSITVDTGGVPHIVYTKTVTETIMYLATQSGSEWNLEFISDDVSPTVSGDIPVKSGSDNYLWILIVRDIGNGNQLFAFKETASGWDEAIAFDTPVHYPEMALDADNHIHAVFIDDAAENLKYLHYNGTQWLSEVIDDEFDSDFWPSDIELDSSGEPHVAYVEDIQREFLHGDKDLRYAVRSQGVWYKYSVDIEGWADHEDGANEPGYHDGDLALDSFDTPHFSYMDDASRDLCYATCGIFSPPRIDYVTPNTVFPGERFESTFVYGDGLSPVTLVDFGENVAIDYIDNENNTRLRVSGSVNADAAAGPRNVRVVAPAGATICQDCFVVCEPGDPPVINSVFPDYGNSGETLSVLIEGDYFTDTVRVNFGAYCDVAQFTVVDSGHITATIAISPSASEISQDVSVVNLHGEAVCRQCFHIDFTAPSTPTPTPTSSTPTQAPTFTPTPTWTPTVNPTQTSTSTPTPTSSPSLTPTSPQTRTPTPTPPTNPTSSPTPTASSSPTPSPTSSQCTTTGVEIIMPSEIFKAGDMCNCHAILCNAEGHTISGYPLFVLLDVYGSYFFAPSFNETFDNYLAAYPSFSEGTTDIEVLPDFEWPENAGSINGILWYGAMTTPEMTDLFGTMGTFQFGWE